MQVTSTVVGYPYNGEKREWQAAIEQFWNGELSETALDEHLQAIRLQRLQQQMKKYVNWFISPAFKKGKVK